MKASEKRFFSSLSMLRLVLTKKKKNAVFGRHDRVKNRTGLYEIRKVGAFGFVKLWISQRML